MDLHTELPAELRGGGVSSRTVRMSRPKPFVLPMPGDHRRACPQDLHAWLVAQIDDHRIEPNSGLGQAIAYLITLFLRVPGAPLDNNVGHAGSGMSRGMPRREICRVRARGIDFGAVADSIDLRDAA